MSSSHAIAAILVEPDLDKVSVKRIAWAFGCARKDTEEERQLYRLLLRKLDRVRAQRTESEAA